MTPPGETFQLPPSDEVVRLLSQRGDSPDVELLVAAIAKLGGQRVNTDAFAQFMAQVLAEIYERLGFEEAEGYRAHLIGYIEQIVTDEATRGEIVKRL